MLCAHSHDVWKKAVAERRMLSCHLWQYGLNIRALRKDTGAYMSTVPAPRLPPTLPMWSAGIVVRCAAVSIVFNSTRPCALNYDVCLLARSFVVLR